MDNNRKVESPCRKLCHLDMRSGHCKGCKRSIDEIRRWPDMSDEERQSVLEQLETRKIPSFLS